MYQVCVYGDFLVYHVVMLVLSATGMSTRTCTRTSFYTMVDDWSKHRLPACLPGAAVTILTVMNTPFSLYQQAQYHVVSSMYQVCTAVLSHVFVLRTCKVKSALKGFCCVDVVVSVVSARPPLMVGLGSI